ncbi:hypothetical protein RF11_13686 [Thelohanellus kitauei]|uniref:Uncharacterized protein n=1 Tax=Thelohanellus kitauei TaxID=669202 RepID=A0A0C2MU61_THEKT|nr:hypothetical protein RF11_13686 [Thelohanellus kitauei]
MNEQNRYLKQQDQYEKYRKKLREFETQVKLILKLVNSLKTTLTIWINNQQIIRNQLTVIAGDYPLKLMRFIITIHKCFEYGYILHKELGDADDFGHEHDLVHVCLFTSNYIVEFDDDLWNACDKDDKTLHASLKEILPKIVFGQIGELNFFTFIPDFLTCSDIQRIVIQLKFRAAILEVEVSKNQGCVFSMGLLSFRPFLQLPIRHLKYIPQMDMNHKVLTHG